MLRKVIVTAALAGALAAPAGVQARPHAGCVVTAATPTCSYTAIGSHSCAGATEASWEVYVTRTVGGVEQKVVLASGSGAIVGDAVDANANERVTQVIKPDGPGGQPAGAVTCGNTAGHP